MRAKFQLSFPVYILTQPRGPSKNDPIHIFTIPDVLTESGMKTRCLPLFSGENAVHVFLNEHPAYQHFHQGEVRNAHNLLRLFDLVQSLGATHIRFDPIDLDSEDRPTLIEIASLVESLEKDTPYRRPQ